MRDKKNNDGLMMILWSPGRETGDYYFQDFLSLTFLP
jgi:hypothetical protein